MTSPSEPFSDTSFSTQPRKIELRAETTHQHSGSRFDQVAAELFPDYSRSRIQEWIKEGALLADGRSLKTNAKLIGGEELTLSVEIIADDQWLAQDIPLNIVFEDEHILIINKPAYLVVHPAAGNQEGTLLNGLLFHYPELSQVPRAGIVHRLDKDTSGLMVVAKTIEAQTSLVQQLQDKSVYREYFAIVKGEVARKDTIRSQIGRHPTARTKMAVVERGGKDAVTHYERIAFANDASAVKVRLETGRTHQIRVHMAEQGNGLVGDPVYGGGSFTKKERMYNPLLDQASLFPRQALHARCLGLVHPVTGEALRFESEIPEDIAELAILLELKL